MNLAARLTGIARAGTLVIPRSPAAYLSSRDGIEVANVRRTFDVKGIGNTRDVHVRRGAPTKDAT